VKHHLERHRREHSERLRRVRLLLRRLPRRANVRRYPVVRWFADIAHRRPWLWSFKQAHVVPALYAGAIIGLLPMPGQLVLGCVAAFLLRANLPIITGLCFASNPLTMVPLFSACYISGYTLLHYVAPGTKEYRLSAGLSAVASGQLSGVWDVLATVALGAVVVGFAAGAILHLAWRLGAWEAKRFKARLARLRAAAADEEARASGRDE
jgi:uncharacterized protein (DUF2062 family)